MKSPAQLGKKLQRQWESGEIREKRLLDPGEWPLSLSIGKPTPKQMTEALPRVREHIRSWRAVTPGEVEWQALSYRSIAEPVELPLWWHLRDATEWLAATAQRALQEEYRLIAAILTAVNPRYHPLIVRQRQLILARDAEETVRACRIADEVTPGCAAGKPLRTLSIAGSDTKFFERNRTLLQRVLECRFGPEALESGLEVFLGAPEEGEHWLLVAPLAEGLLPFRQQRIRSSELAHTPLPASHILIIENERPLYQLPPLPDTIAILGAGLNLGWMAAKWLAERQLAYWGDLDSWGVAMLATARRLQPNLTPLLMDRATFDAYAHRAVSEPVPAGDEPPEGLEPSEAMLYRHLIQSTRGRVEQEFIPAALVEQVLSAWRAGGSTP